MKTVTAFLWALLAIILAGCASTKTAHRLSYSGGDGSSSEQAVIINDAKYREAGLLAERLWLEQKYPGCRQVSKQAVNAGARVFELVEVTTADGQAMKVYFDATEFCAK